MTALDELDGRLARAGAEISTTFASAPAGTPRRVMRRAARQRATMGASAAAAVIAVGAITLTIGGDGGERQVASRSSEPGGPGTTTGGATDVGALDDLPALALSGGSWQLSDATEHSRVGGDNADAVPSRHVRYVNDTGGIVSLDLFAVPAGSFYETIVPLLTATDGFSPIRIRGVEGRVGADDSFFSMAWRESSTTIASLSVHGANDQAEAIAIAEGLVTVDQSQWQTMMSQASSADGPTRTTIEDRERNDRRPFDRAAGGAIGG